MSHVLLTDGREAWSVERSPASRNNKAKGGKSIWAWTVGRYTNFLVFMKTLDDRLKLKTNLTCF